MTINYEQRTTKNIKDVAHTVVYLTTWLQYNKHILTGTARAEIGNYYTNTYANKTNSSWKYLF